MTESTGTPPDSPREARPPLGRIVWTFLRAAGSTAVLLAVYYLLPLDRSAEWVAVMTLAIGLAALIGLVALQVRAISGSRYPGLRALEALAFTIPLFLLLFASTYLVMAALSARNFSQPLNHTGALYFTVTVFATVGFGDITPIAAVARLVVTGQMLVDLIILGLGARVILGAVSRGRQRRPPEPGPSAVVPPG
jgi:voltage-gated potassium channel